MKPSFIFLPLSNEKYSYMLLLDTGEIIEYENGKEITKFGDYELFKQYYLKLNQRVCLPDEIEGFSVQMNWRRTTLQTKIKS